MTWLGLTSAVAVGTTAAPSVNTVLRGIGVIALVLIAAAVFG